MGESLRKRGMQVDDRCKRCGEIESTLHVMFSCPFAKHVWERIPTMLVPSTTSVRCIGEPLQVCSRMINLPPQGLSLPLYPWLLWVLWTSRNQLIFEDKSFTETEVMMKAIKHAKEWQTANEKSPAKTLVSSKDYSSNPAQKQVQENAYVCYSDGAWNSVSSAGGMGWSISAPNGDTIYQGSTSRMEVASALVTEALALRAALECSEALGIRDMVCLSDSKSLVNQITVNYSVIA